MSRLNSTQRGTYSCEQLPAKVNLYNLYRYCGSLYYEEAHCAHDKRRDVLVKEYFGDVGFIINEYLVDRVSRVNGSMYEYNIHSTGDSANGLNIFITISMRKMQEAHIVYNGDNIITLIDISHKNVTSLQNDVEFLIIDKMNNKISRVHVYDVSGGYGRNLNLISFAIYQYDDCSTDHSMIINRISTATKSYNLDVRLLVA